MGGGGSEGAENLEGERGVRGLVWDLDVGLEPKRG